jgi:hypothetical protein
LRIGRRGRKVTAETLRMITAAPLDFIPVWVLFLATLALVLVSVEIGHRLGSYRRVKPDHENEGPVGAMVGATLGLLAFLLAFTFSLAASRFDTRKDLVLEEANAIGTTYLRAAMLPEGRDEIRSLLRQYVEIRTDLSRTTVDEVRRRSEELQNQVWDHATVVARRNPNPLVALFVASLNETIDVHGKRVHAITQNRIPAAIWGALYLVSVLALASMGYHAGVVGRHRPLAVFAVAIAFSAVLGLIADLDRPGEGLLRVSQQAMVDLRASMTEPAPTTRP